MEETKVLHKKPDSEYSVSNRTSKDCRHHPILCFLDGGDYSRDTMQLCFIEAAPVTAIRVFWWEKATAL